MGLRGLVGLRGVGWGGVGCREAGWEGCMMDKEQWGENDKGERVGKGAWDKSCLLEQRGRRSGNMGGASRAGLQGMETLGSLIPGSETT